MLLKWDNHNTNPGIESVLQRLILFAISYKTKYANSARESRGKLTYAGKLSNLSYIHNHLQSYINTKVASIGSKVCVIK